MKQKYHCISQIFEKNLSINKGVIFSDRDGTIIEDVHFLRSKDQVKILPNVCKGLKKITSSGKRIVIITNQAVVARGWISENELTEINDYICKLFQSKGVNISAIYSCPHHPNATLPKYRLSCKCRKPEIGMFLQASQDFNIKLEGSYMIGDGVEDVIAGKKVGISTIMIGSAKDKANEVSPDFYVDDILSATQIVFGVK